LPVGQKGWLTFVWAVSFFFLFVTLFLIWFNSNTLLRAQTWAVVWVFFIYLKNQNFTSINYRYNLSVIRSQFCAAPLSLRQFISASLCIKPYKIWYLLLQLGSTIRL
jgi:hypothetical protein